MSFKYFGKIVAIIQSLLDTDLYKLTMQKAVLRFYDYSSAKVTYRFTNRNPQQKFSAEFFKHLQEEINSLQDVRLTDEEAEWLTANCPYLVVGSSDLYIDYLREYSFDPSQVDVSADANGDLSIKISGPWSETILWEVPLMAIISELYFAIDDTDWYYNGLAYKKMTYDKMSRINHSLAEFGTRRRRNYAIQDDVCYALSNHLKCIGTSNVHFAMKHGMKPIGTCAHEWTMGISVLESLRHANRYALKRWQEVYGNDLSIALTDTYGTDAFFKDFDLDLASNYNGVRHDSGDPFVFADRVIEYYNKLGIDPTNKTIIFSDSLDPDLCIKIRDYCQGRIGFAFGVGTNLTNDKAYFIGSKPLNMVIKLRTCDGIPVVKLSDDEGKATGDPDAVSVAGWTFFGTPLSTQ